MDTIPFKTVPIANYDDLNQQLGRLNKGHNLSFVIFLNCGASLDLESYEIFEKETKTRAIIIDSYRPIHHNNVHSEKQVGFKANLDCSTGRQ